MVDVLVTVPAKGSGLLGTDFHPQHVIKQHVLSEVEPYHMDIELETVTVYL